MILAFVGAEDEFSFWNREILKLADKVKEIGLEDFEMEIAGIQISCDIETKNVYDRGETMPGGMLMVKDGKEGEMTVTFEMKKVNSK